jgi:two-component system sensor histidine kinase QseC
MGHARERRSHTAAPALARVEEQGVERSACRLDAIAKEVIAELAPKALDANQDIALDAPEPIEIPGNAALLAAMLRNLIDNALRHGGSPLHVTVSLTRGDGTALMTVADDGRGVPPASLDALGSRFFRPAGTQAGGSGLGLALARRIAEWHGGSLDISVGPPGRGLRVCMTFPLPKLT